MTESTTPHWFQRAIDAPSEHGEVEVDGVPIHYVTWGEVGKPGIALVHGSNAHLEWWRFVAPYLADQFRVVALDSSGNGLSGWRERYDGRTLGDEVWAVCEAAQLGERPFVVGHSFGGFVVLETGHAHGDKLGGIIFMDFTVQPPENYVEWGMRAEREGKIATRGTRVYEDREAALARFRYLPEQPVRHPEVLRYIAEQSLREVEGGWTWRFDPTLFDYLEMGIDQRDKWAGLACRNALVLGELSEDDGAFGAPYMLEASGGTLPVFAIPGAYHHLMFDEPLAVVAAIKGIVLSWLQQDRAAHGAAALDRIVRGD